VTAQVSNNKAVASFTVPAGLSAGTYTITASYSDPSGDFQSSHAAGTLTLTPAGPVIIVVPAVTAPFPNTDPTISLNAGITGDPPGFSVNGIPVAEGETTLTIAGLPSQPITVPVVNGQSSFNFILPANSPVGVYTVTVTYTDPAGNYQS